MEYLLLLIPLVIILGKIGFWTLMVAHFVFGIGAD